MEKRYFTATHISEDVVKKSSSGGIFTALTDEWFDEYADKAVVYGCVLDNELNAKHVRAADKSTRDKMRGSKYISSDTKGVYKAVYDDLRNGRYVVFSGTPCQTAALKSYLSVLNLKTDKNLLTVEILCHGIGSNAFFEDYISHLEKKYKSKAVSCSFRAKKRHGKSQDMEVAFSNGKKYNASSTQYDWFYSAYMKNYILRPSCFSCKFAKTERNSDICIFDNWKEMYSDSGSEHLSAVIVSSELGYIWFEKCSNQLSFEKKSFEDISQHNLCEPTHKPDDYNKFWNIYNHENGYLKVQKYIGNRTFKGYVRMILVELLFRLNLIDAVKKIKKRFGR